MTFVVALILQNIKGIKPMIGDRLCAPKNIAQMDIIPYGVHAHIHTTISVTTILESLSSVSTCYTYHINFSIKMCTFSFILYLNSKY